MKIFGIGLSRTGTVSLTTALKILGYNVIHAPRPACMPALYHTLLDYDGATDSCIAHNYKELDEAFPNSKFILTTRTLKPWLESYKNFLQNWRDFEWDEIDMQLSLYGSLKFDVELYKKGYIKHHADVFSYFKDRPNDLLVIDFSVDDNWRKICQFLVRIPDYPFPHNNKGNY